MSATLDRIDASLAGLRTRAERGEPLPFIEEGHDFVVGPPMEEAELLAIERKYELALPPEYRSFRRVLVTLRLVPEPVPACQRRANCKVEESVSARRAVPRHIIPMHQRLAKERQWEDYGELLKQWKPIPRKTEFSQSSDYGCAIYGVLILNGRHLRQGLDSARRLGVMAPSAGPNVLHNDQSWPPEWTATEHPRDYSFLECT